MQGVMKKLGLSHRPDIGPVPSGVWKILGLRPGMEARPEPKGLRTVPGLGRARTGEVRRGLLTALGLQPHPADRGKPLGLITGFGPRPVGMGLRSPRGLLVTPGLRPSPLQNAAPHGWLAAFGLHPRGVTPGRLRAALGLGPAVPSRGLSIIAAPRPRAPMPPLPKGILAGLGLIPASAQFTRRREPMLAGGLSKPRPPQPARMAPKTAPGEFFLKLRARMPTLDTSQPRQWLEAARERLAALRRG
jgi:hypothetical protein